MMNFKCHGILLSVCLGAGLAAAAENPAPPAQHPGIRAVTPPAAKPGWLRQVKTALAGDRQTGRKSLADTAWNKLRNKITGTVTLEAGTTSYQWPEFNLPEAKAPTERELDERQANAGKIQKKLLADLELIQKLDAEFTPESAATLQAFALDARHPFAPRAVEVLAAHPCPASAAALRTALKAKNETVENLALQALVAFRDPAAPEAARARLNRGGAALRRAAIFACGELRLAAAVPALREITQNSQPMLQICAAAALLRINHDPDARTLLEKTARAGYYDGATLALAFLGMEPDARTAGFCLALLDAENPRTAGGAAEILRQIPPETVRQALRPLPEDARRLAFCRWQILNFLTQEKAPCPRAACRWALDHGNGRDRVRVLECWEKQPAAENLPLLITLAVAPRENSQIADKALWMLEEFLKKSEENGARYAAMPQDLRSPAAWVKWWYRQCRLLAVAPGQALLQLPDGSTQPASVTDTLAFSARLRAVTAGPAGPTDIEGARAEIVWNGQTYAVYP